MQNFGFNSALECLRGGERVARAGWNGKGMWLIYADGGTFKIGDRIEGDLTPFVVLMHAGKFTPWAPSTEDMLALDWQLVESEQAPYSAT